MVSVDPFESEGDPGRISFFSFSLHLLKWEGGPPHARDQPHRQLTKGMVAHEGGWGGTMLADEGIGEWVGGVTEKSLLVPRIWGRGELTGKARR